MTQKKAIKKIVSVFFAIIVMLCFSTCLLVVDSNAITPRWVGIVSINVQLVFDGNEGTVTGTANKQSTASRIEGTLYIYKLVGDDWIYVDEWYNSKTRGTLSVGGDFACESGVTYKAVFVVTVYTNGIPESDTKECIKVCP